MDFSDKLKKTITTNNSLLCIGLDTDVEKIPEHLKNDPEPAFVFNKAIIDATHDLVCSYKANIAFYAAQGTKGLTMLIKTIQYIHDKYTGIPVILDAKRADTGNTSKQYVKEVFDVIGADAVTVNPYLGVDSLEPFLKRKDKGVIVLCKTSNPGASDFQNTEVSIDIHFGGVLDRTRRETRSEPLYIHVAKHVVEWNKKYGNCLLVVGATWPEELKKLRELVTEMFFLIPGVGGQGGNLQKTLENGLTKGKSGLIIHSARAIIYASNDKIFAKRARSEATRLKEKINRIRNYDN